MKDQLGIEFVHLRASTRYQVSSLGTFVPQLDTWYRVDTRKGLNLILGIELGLICVATRYQVSSWGHYGDELDTWYRVWVHLRRNSIPSIELGLISAKIPVLNDIRP